MRTIHRLLDPLPAAVAVALLLAAAPAGAVDGVFEIAPACVAAGCFPGDDPGFPVEITQPGSYRLTGNLQVPDADTSAIRLAGGLHGVAIDLNGFTIQGVTDCGTDPLPACSPQGGGSGVEATAAGISGASVRNGTVRGMGNDGIILGRGGLVTDVTVENNGSNGVALLSGSVVHVLALRNGGEGVFQNSGLSTDAASIESSIAIANRLAGLRIVGPGTITGSTSIVNGSHGIECGICTVRGNTSEQNAGVGLSAFRAGYAENTFVDNNSGGAQVSGGIEIGVNLCQTNTVCP
jgi:hypothetical protein